MCLDIYTDWVTTSVHCHCYYHHPTTTTTVIINHIFEGKAS